MQKLVIWYPLGPDGLKGKEKEWTPAEVARERVEARRRRRQELLAVVRRAENARMKYRELIYKGDPSTDVNFVQEEFAKYLDEEFMPPLWAALEKGIITPAEFQEVTAGLWQAWTALALEVMAHRAGTWCSAYWGWP